MPITRRSTLPQNYEERLARIYCNVLSSATNSVVMLYLKGNEQSLPEIRKVLDEVNPFFLKKRPSDLKAILSGSLCRAGVDSKIDDEDVWYTLNEEGRYLVRPLAAHTLIWFYNNSDSCPELVFGKDCGPTNAPYQRARMIICVNDLSRELSEKLSEESSRKSVMGLSEKLPEEPAISLELDQICKRSGMRKPDVQHILYKIANTGLILYEHPDANQEFVFYRWKGEEVSYLQVKWIGEGNWIGEGVVKRIVDYLYERKNVNIQKFEGSELISESPDNWISPRQIWKELNLGQRNFAYTVVSALYKQGYLEQKKGEMRKAQVRASSQLNKLCELLSDINTVVNESISNIHSGTNGNVDGCVNGIIKTSRNLPSNLLRTMQSEAEKLTDRSRESKAIIDEMIRRHVEALRR